jgi:hypothetical protein
MSQSARKILERVQTRPPQDLEELADRAREIDAHRTRVYDLAPEEEAATRDGLAGRERGEWTNEQTMRAFWVRCGVL